MSKTQGFVSVSTKQQWIAKLSREKRGEALTSLHHLIDMQWMLEAWKQVRKGGATGVDKETSKMFRESLLPNLATLQEEILSGSYKAPPVRRVHISKGDGKTRPLGIPTFRDKIAQKAISMLLEPIYEEEFYPESYGYRKRKSAHQALTQLRGDLMKRTGGWVFDLDMSDYFGSVDHKHLRIFLDKRINDGVIRRMIDKWLSAGVLEEGLKTDQRTGVPQGGIVSPLLANIYLHYVMDEWLEETVKSHLIGDLHWVRYADDVVLFVTSFKDVKRLWDVIPKRLDRYSLKLNEEKSQVIEFRRPFLRGKRKRGSSFDFLGFTHYWSRTRRGGWSIKRKTSAKSFRKGVRIIRKWCHRNMHEPLEKQTEALKRKVLGHYRYFGLPSNSKSLERFREAVTQAWRSSLMRRSQRAYLSWSSFRKIGSAIRSISIKVYHPSTSESFV